MKKMVVASGNKGKLREIAEIFKGYEIVSMQAAGFSGDIEENGSTFEENALIKARAVCKALGAAALADRRYAEFDRLLNSKLLRMLVRNRKNLVSGVIQDAQKQLARHSFRINCGSSEYVVKINCLLLN